jgi:hypothetical protein
MKRLLLVLLMTGLPMAAFAQKNDAEGEDGKDTAWTRSVAAEVAGDIAGAEDILIEAWGADGGNYFIQLRRAYLALLQGRFSQAQARYAALQASDEGAADPDVAAGLHAARTRILPGSSASEVPARFHPEVWGALVGQSLGNTSYLGGAIFAHVPVRITPELRFHVAGRYVDYQRQGGGSRWAFGQTGARRITLGDVFLGADYQRPWWGVDALGVYEKLSGSSSLAGGSLRGRVGQRFGLMMDGTLLSAGSSANWQVVPLAFFWPVSILGLRAGTRLTFDGRQSTSVMAGASLFLGGHSLHMDGHLGNERAALNPGSFSLLNLSGDATLGGTLTLALRLSKTVRLLAQAQGERLTSDGADGAYWSASLGVDMAFGSL